MLASEHLALEWALLTVVERFLDSLLFVVAAIADFEAAVEEAA